MGKTPVPKQGARSGHPHNGSVRAEIRCVALDEDLTPEMRDGILEAAEKARHLPVVLEQSEVVSPQPSMNTRMVLLTELRRAGQHFMLLGVQPSACENLAAVRLDKVFDSDGDTDGAVEQIRPSA